jgi:type IV fimbrial biogenesis protein FimT
MSQSHAIAPVGRSAPPQAAARGFTLIELLVTITVGGILLGLAVPAFRSFLQNDKLMTEANSLVISLAAARAEAIKQDVAGGVSVCASSDAATCNSANWAQGWIVLSAAGGPPIQVVGGLPTGNTMTEANGQSQVTFVSSGQTTSAANAYAFTICDTRGAAFARYTQVSVTGRVASSNTPGQDLTGAALACP